MFESLFTMDISSSEISHSMNDDSSHKYRWIAFMDRLSDGDITKHEEIYRRNYIETLNLLSWWKTRDDAQRMANIAQQNR
jgi:hypothetical protein